jgi:signal transduction histidine kinase
MLGFTKVSRFQRQETDVVALVNEAVALFRQSGGRRVEVALTLPGQASFEVDPVLLRHALFNLLANAGQALDGQGRVWLALAPQPSALDAAPGWLFTVEDDGPGLTPQVQQHLFEPFFTTRAEGTGLGLPVVLHVALAHGGWVEAANRSEGGARFTLWVPDKEEAHGVAD